MIVGIGLLNFSLPFSKYLKSDEINHYSLAEINKTDILGNFIDIRYSEEGLFFIYEDGFFNDYHYKAIKQICIDYGIEFRLIDNGALLRDILNDSAGINQIGMWSRQEAF
jgi:hypothetical protein